MGNDRAVAVRARRGRTPAAYRALSAAAALLLAPLVVLAAAPARVASLNLCTDSLLLELVDDQRISSITTLSRDPNLSVHHARARTLPVNHGAVEEILGTRPDLVLIGSNTTVFAEHLLARIGLEVMSFATANTLDEYQANLRRLARRLGVEQRAESLLSKLAATLAMPPASALPLRALVYQPNGFMPGRASLMHDLLRRAGLRNIASERGLEFGTYLSLEALLAAAPDVIVFSNRVAVTPSLAEAQLDHPVMRKLRARDGRPPRRAGVPENLWTCAGAFSGAAVALLRESGS